MLLQNELELKTLAELAVLCGNVTRSLSLDAPTVAKAHALRLEWVRLQKPIHPVLEEKQKIQAQRDSLKKRMTESLSTTS